MYLTVNGFFSSVNLSSGRHFYLGLISVQNEAYVVSPDAAKEPAQQHCTCDALLGTELLRKKDFKRIEVLN